MSLIQSSQRMKKVALVGLVLAAVTVVLLAVALVLARGETAAMLKSNSANTALAQAVAALASDPIRAQTLAQSASGTPGAAIVVSQAKSLEPVSPQIQARAAALTSLLQAQAQTQASTAAISQSQFFSSGPWAQALAPLLSEAARPEFQDVAAVFASGRDPQAMSQWSTRLSQFSAEASRLGEIAARDRNMPEPDKKLLEDLVASSGAAAEAMKELLPLAGVSAQVAAAVSLAAPALASPPPAPPSSMASAVLMLALLPALGMAGCLVVIMLAAGSVRAHVDAVVSNSRQASKNTQATTRLLDHIHALVPSGGAVYLDEHLVEPADSPMFPVASAFNRLIDVAAMHRDNARSLQTATSEHSRALGNEIALVSKSIQALHAKMSDLSSQLLQQAKVVAGLSEETKRQAASTTHHADSARDSSSSLQSAILRLEATRSTNQEASKRIKRMGESSQAIELASSRLQSMNQQVKVVAANIATAAAARGSDGRDFMVLADQVQRLVQSGVEVSQDISQIIDLMKSDASAVTSAMERSTGDHVEGGRVLETASALLSEIERGLPDLSTNAAQSLSGLENHALALSDVAAQLSSMRSAIEDATQSLSRLATSASSLGQDPPAP